jgi:hypothetical protein
MIEGSVNALAFEADVEHTLAPSLSAGQIVVLDNLSAHKGGRVPQLIEARGCERLFLPASSPDSSPILRDLLQSQGVCAPCRCQNPSGAPTGSWASTGDSHGSGCARLVHPLWLSACPSKRPQFIGSIFLNTAVSREKQEKGNT